MQFWHHLKKFQRASMVYTRLSQYKPAEELAPIKNTTRTMISSVSSPEEPHKDMSERPHWQAFKDSSESPHLGKREIINPRSLATQFGLMAGVLLRHKARNFGFRVLPDGFVRVSEILQHFHQFRRFTFDEFEYLVLNDPMSRFEMKLRYDMILGVGKLEKVWWVRAKYGHTIPGVDAATRRILNPGKLGNVYYITHASNWIHIREHGIPQGPDHQIPLFNMSPYNNIFFDRVPAYTKALRISIDTRKALYMGVMFFHTKETRLIASGNLERTIPLEVFKSVVELEFTNVTLN